MKDRFSALIPFLKAPQELVAVQEMQVPQNPPLEVVEGPSTFNDLGRLEVDIRLLIPANTHLRDIVTSVDVRHTWSVPSSLGVKCEPDHFPFILRFTLYFFFSCVVFNILMIMSYCDGINAFSAPSTPLPPEAVTPPPELPVPEPVPQPVVIPQLDHPLILDNTRRSLLYTRYLLLNFGGNDNLRRMVSIIDYQLIVERNVEAALVDDGFNPNAILARYTTIRGILHSPQGELLTERTYHSYVTQIRERGTRQSVPYLRIRRAIRNYDLVL